MHMEIMNGVGFYRCYVIIISLLAAFYDFNHMLLHEVCCVISVYVQNKNVQLISQRSAKEFVFHCK